MTEVLTPTSWASAVQALGLIVVSLILSWIARRLARRTIRRAARRAARSPVSAWRVRRGEPDESIDQQGRIAQRADAVARLVGQAVTAIIVTVAFIGALERLGVDLAVSISSAGFLGFALALSGQGVIRDLIEGTRTLVEDRYALGDDVSLLVGDRETRGIVEVLGTGSVRLRLADRASWHARHDAIECVINQSQPPAVTTIGLPADTWANLDRSAAAEQLVAASNDIGLTGVVFLGDLAEDGTSENGGDGSVPVRSNRPLSRSEGAAVRRRIIESGIDVTTKSRPQHPSRQS